jgi:ribosomal protein S2
MNYLLDAAAHCGHQKRNGIKMKEIFILKREIFIIDLQKTSKN